MSINRLSLMIQEKISKLNAGNLSMEELDELKEMTTELNERVIVLQYKAAEAQLLKQAGEIIQHTGKKETATEKPEITAPIKLDLGNVTPVERPASEIPAVKPEPVTTQAPVVNKPEQAPVKPAEELQTHVEEKVRELQMPAEEKTAVQPKPLEPVSPARVSLVERMQKTKIHDLKTAIGLNQKFLFMNYLFEGENTSYNDAIEKLNNMPTAADARHYIRELAYIYSWNYEDENVVLFTEYVERRHM